MVWGKYVTYHQILDTINPRERSELNLEGCTFHIPTDLPTYRPYTRPSASKLEILIAHIVEGYMVKDPPFGTDSTLVWTPI